LNITFNFQGFMKIHFKTSSARTETSNVSTSKLRTLRDLYDHHKIMLPDCMFTLHFGYDLFHDGNKINCNFLPLIYG
jgi:hypothetical protein